MKPKVQRTTAMAMLFVFVFVSSVRPASAVWTSPEQITLNGAVGEDAELAITFDNQGTVHFAHTLTFIGGSLDADNFLFYGNNSDPTLDYTGFPMSEDDKVLITNRPGDGAALTYIHNPSISANVPGSPVVAFDAILDGGNREAYASFVNTSTGIPYMTQLSTFSPVYKKNTTNNVTYSYFDDIDHLGSEFIATNWSSTDPYVVGFQTTNPASPSNLTRLTYFDYPIASYYKDSRIYATSGNTFVIFEANQLNSIGRVIGLYGFDQRIVKMWYNSNHSVFAITKDKTIHWLNISNEKIISEVSSIKIDSTGVPTDITGNGTYIYVSMGADGIFTFNYDETSSSSFAQTSHRLVSANQYVRAIALNEDNNSLYLATDYGVYNCSLLTPESPGVLNFMYNDYLPYTAIDYSDNILAVGDDSGNLQVFNFNAGSTYHTTTSAGIEDLLIKSGYIYIAIGESGLAVHQIGGIGILTTWSNGGSGSINSFSLSVAGPLPYLLVCDSELDLVVMDISNPATTFNDVDIKRTKSGGGPVYVAPDRMIYMTDREYGFVSIDASNSDALKVTSIFPNLTSYGFTSSYGGLYVYNNFAYLTGGSSGSAGMFVINLTSLNTESPTGYYFNSSEFSANLNDIKIISNGTETWSYISDATNNQLLLLNVTSNPFTSLVSGTTGAGTFVSPNKMAVSDFSGSIIVYLADDTGGVRVLNVSRLDSPSLLSTLTTTGAALDCDVERDVLAVAEGASGIGYFDISDIASLGTENLVATSNASNAVALYSCAAVVATAGSGIGYVDTSDFISLGITTLDNYPTVSYFDNGTAIVMWHNENGLFYRYLYSDDYSKSRIYQFSSDTNDQYPQIEIQTYSNSTYVHVIFVDTTATHQVWYSRAVDNGSFSAPVQVDGNPGVNCDNARIDTNGNTVGIVWTIATNNDIQITISTDNGATFGAVTSVTSTASIIETNPDLYVKDGGYAEVIYQRSMAQNYTVCIRENYDGTFVDHEEFVADYVEGESSQTSPVIAEYNGTVMSMFQNYAKPGTTWDQAELFAFGYQTIHFDIAGGNSSIVISDDPGGKYLFEGFRISYNTTASTDLNLTFRIVDRESGNEWKNTTLIPATGAQNEEFKFWSPNDYFITDNNYDLFIYNGSNWGDQLIKIALDDLSPQNETYFTFLDTPDWAPQNGSLSGGAWVNGTYVNGTFSIGEFVNNTYLIKVYVNGTYVNGSYIDGVMANQTYYTGDEALYSLFISPVFEYVNQIILDSNGLENEENKWLGQFGSTNYVDLVYFELEEDREYNFYFNDSTSGVYGTLYMFPEDVQLTNNLSKSIFSMSSATKQNYRYLCTKTGIYFALIQPAEQFFNQTMDYEFYFSAIPLPPTLLNPIYDTFIGLDNETLGYQPINLQWISNAFDSDIVSYNVEIYTNETLNPEYLVENITIDDKAQQNYTFNAVNESYYYWRVRAIDDSIPQNLGTWSDVGLFKFDKTPPLAPIVHSLNKSHSLDYLTISWNPSDDGIFSAERYYVYISNRPIFQEGTNASDYDKWLVTPNGVKQTYFTYSNLRNYHYYIVVIAEDHVGQNSTFSNVVDTTVAIGGYVSAVGQDLPLQVGDTLVYEVTSVQSDRKNNDLKPLMTFYYHDFTQGYLFHFWVQEVNPNEVYPVISEFYARDPNAVHNDWYLIDDRTPITLMAMSPDQNYQHAVTELWIRNNLVNQTLDYQTYKTLWRRGTTVVSVVVHTYYGEVDSDGYQTSASFFVDEKTGILCEMTFYDKLANYGYSLQLDQTGTSVSFAESDWQYAPIYLTLGGVAIAVIIAQIIKKVEY